MAASSTPKKSTARRPAKKTPPKLPVADTPTTVAGFRAQSALPVVQLPSGNSVRMRRPGLPEFLRAGMLPDPLVSVVEEMIAEGQRLSPSQRKAKEQKLNNSVREQMTDPSKLGELFRFMDRVAAHCWVEPALVHHEVQEENGEWRVLRPEERDTSNYLYTDEIGEEDKSFTFNYAVGGAADLDRFRQESGKAVGALLSGEDVELPAQ